MIPNLLLMMCGALEVVDRKGNKNHVIRIEPNKEQIEVVHGAKYEICQKAPETKDKTHEEETEPLPLRSIKMTVHNAKDLDGHWFDQGEFGKMDPYVVVNHGQEKFKSSIVKNSQNPEWKYDFKLYINRETPDEVTLEVYDADVGKDDALGRATISLREIITDKIKNKWIKLEETKSGEVLFSAEYNVFGDVDESKEVDTQEKYDSEKDSKSPTPSDKDSSRRQSQGSIQLEKKDSRNQSRVSAHDHSDDEEKQVYDANYEICHKTPDTMNEEKKDSPKEKEDFQIPVTESMKMEVHHNLSASIVSEEKLEPFPCGSITLTLHRASHLEGEGKLGKADPYAVLTLGDEKKIQIKYCEK